MVLSLATATASTARWASRTHLHHAITKRATFALVAESVDQKNKISSRAAQSNKSSQLRIFQGLLSRMVE